MAEELHRAAALPNMQQSLELHREGHVEHPPCFWFNGDVVERVMVPS